MTERVSFVIGGEEPVTVLEAQPFRSAQVNGFSRVSLQPAVLERADPAVEENNLEQIPTAAWTRWEPGPQVVITGPRLDWLPAVTIEPCKEGKNGSLKSIRARPGTKVVMEITGGKNALYLDLRLAGTGAIAHIDASDCAYLMIDNGRIAGMTLSEPVASETFRVTRSPATPLFSVEGARDSLSFNIEIAPERIGRSMVEETISVAEIDFDRQGSRGKRISTLITDGEIQYPDYRTILARTIPAGYALRVAPEVALQLLTLELTRIGDQTAILMKLGGEARTIRSGTRPSPTDYRLNRFDMLWNDPTLIAVFTVAAWIFATTVGVWNFWKELRK
jgi:hypothetical protein